MYSSLDGKSNLHVNLQPLKAPASIVVKDSGKESIPERRGHSPKANFPILVTPSGIIRDPDKCEHRSKALSPIDAMLSGRVKCMRDSLFLRAPGGNLTIVTSVVISPISFFANDPTIGSFYRDFFKVQ